VCDGALELGVCGLVDYTPAPAAELLQDTVVGNGLPDHMSGPTFAEILGRRQGQVNTQAGRYLLSANCSPPPPGRFVKLHLRPRGRERQVRLIGAACCGCNWSNLHPFFVAQLWCNRASARMRFGGGTIGGRLILEGVKALPLILESQKMALSALWLASIPLLYGDLVRGHE